MNNKERTRKNNTIESILTEYGAIGEAAAIPKAVLLQVTGISPRAIRRRVQNERMAGAIICGKMHGEGGYYLPATREEIEHFTNAQNSRIRAAYKAADSARKCLAMIDEQATQGAGLFAEVH